MLSPKIYELLDENSKRTIDRVSWQKLVDEHPEWGYNHKDALRSAYRGEKERRGQNKNHSVSEISSNETPAQSNSENQEKTVYQEGDNYINIICSSPRIFTKEDVIKHFNIDTNIWSVKEFTVKTSEGYRKDRSVQWEVENGVVINGSVNDTGKMLVVPMYHTETKLVRRNEFSFEDVDKFFREYVSTAKSVKSNKRFYSSGKILEIDLADLHVGNVPVNKKDYSIESLCDKTIDSIVAKCKNIQIEKIYLVNLGDLLHYDTYNQTTTKGTSVTSNVDLATIFDMGAGILIRTIDKLLQIAPVEVIGIYGNHDRISSYMLMKAVEFYYRENYDVLVDCGHLPRKFRKFGNCLVMWNHGDMAKNNAYSLIQREARKEFGETKFAEIHSGHFHSQQTIEKDGVVVRYLPSMISGDDWHFREGYTGAVRSTVSFLWDKENGLDEMWFVNVD